MTSTSARKSYPPVPDKSKKTSLLKDNSWIKREVNEEKAEDDNSNFGRSVLNRFKSTENIQSSSENSSGTVTTNTSTVTSPSKSSVQSLTKRFSTSYDDLDSSSTTTTTLKGGTKTTTVTTSRTSVVKSPTKADTFAEKIFTESRTSGKIQTPLKPVESTKSSSITRTGTVTVTSKDSTVQENLKPVKPLAPKPVAPAKSTKTETYTVATSKENTVQVDSNLAKLAPPPPASPAPPAPPPLPTISPSKNTKTETVTVTKFQDTIVREDSKTAKSAPPLSPTKNTKTETVTVTSFKDTIIQDGNKSAFPASPTKSITRADEVFDNLLPTSVKSTYVSDTRSVDRNDKSSGTSSTTYTRRSYTESRPEEYYSESVKTISSPLDSYEYGSQRVSTKTYTSTTYSDSRSDEFLDTYTARSLPSIYTSPDRKIVDKDLCTLCQKPMLGDPKIILEDMDIRCHANCFKCDVCKSTLGHLKAGDSMWVYRRSVQCEACFGATK
ncbi:mucin-22-like isoform X2, partial [Clarias magur]